MCVCAGVFLRVSGNLGGSGNGVEGNGHSQRGGHMGG